MPDIAEACASDEGNTSRQVGLVYQLVQFYVDSIWRRWTAVYWDKVGPIGDPATGDTVGGDNEQPGKQASRTGQPPSAPTSRRIDGSSSG